MKVKIKKVPSGMGDKPEEGTPAYEKAMAMKSGKQIAKMDEEERKMLDNQIKGKWRK